MGFRTSHDKRSRQLSLDREYRVKQQYRLVYSDVGKSLHNAKDLATAFNAIQDIFIALVLLFLADWVHRDVSTGNIIVIEQDGTISGKLSDLEYAKRFGSDQDQPSGKDPKTGTPYFMPFEVHSGRRIYTDPPQSPDDSDLPEDLLAQAPIPAIPSTSERLTPFFRFSYDLESLWWIMLWFLLARVDHPSALALALRVFTYSIKPSPKRGDVFQAPPNDPIVSSAVDPRLSDLFPWIDVIRVRLLISYNKPTPKQQDYVKLYGKYWKYLRFAVEKAKQLRGVTFLNKDDRHGTPSVPAITGEKRQRDESSVETRTEVPHLPRSSSQVNNIADKRGGEEDQTGNPSKRPRITTDMAKTRDRHPSKLVHRIIHPDN